MPDDVMREAMDRLRSDPHEFRRRRDEALSRMARIISDPPQSARIKCDFEIDASLAPAYETCRAFYGMLLGADGPDGDPDVEEEILMYIFCQGLLAELAKIQALRDRLYQMGSLETQADALGMDIGSDDRNILAAETDVSSNTPPTMDEYFKRGYVGARCPRCRKRAAWHPDRGDLICLDGCGKIGEFERKPGPI